jgi:glycosyltransferase involved in cell wall biosynthesis
MKSGKKIVRIFSRLNIGGPSLHVVNLTAGLRQLGYDTTLVVGTPEKFEGDMIGYAQAHQVQPYFIPEFGPSLSLFKDAVAFYKIFKLIKEEQPDIVHTHTFKAGLLGRIAATLLQTPVVIHTYHGHLLSGYGSQLRASVIKLVEKGLCHFTDRAIAVSSRVAQDIVKAGIIPGMRMSVIELGFDLETVKREMQLPSSLRERHQIPDSAKVIAIVGRLVPVKSVDLFLRAMVPILKKRSDVHLAILGDGPLRKPLESLVDELADSNLSLRRRVHFDGWTVPLVNEYKDIDISICSSRNEGTSVAIIESILCGVPVISTRVGGMGDLLDNGRWGKLVEYDKSSLTHAAEDLLEILDLPGQHSTKEAFVHYIRAAAREFWNRFDAERLVTSIADLYQLEMSRARSSRKGVTSSAIEQSR